MPDASFKVTLEGLVDLNGLPKEELEHHLRIGLMNAIGNGLITGHTEAEVDGYQLGISVSELGPESDEDLISQEDFAEAYRPIDLYGDGNSTLETVQEADALASRMGLGDDHQWSVLKEGDNLYVAAGLRREGCVGYIVTEERWRTGNEKAIWLEPPAL